MSPAFRRCILAAAAGLALTAFEARAASDFLLKIDGIDGESTADKHKGYIDILSWSWGVAQAATLGSSARIGKACPTDMSLAKPVDKSSPPLISGAMGGTVSPTAILIGLRGGGGAAPQEYLKVEMKNVLVSSYQVSGSSGGGGATDAFSLRAGSMTVTYYPQKDDGTNGTPVVASFQGGC